MKYLFGSLIYYQSNGKFNQNSETFSYHFLLTEIEICTKKNNHTHKEKVSGLDLNFLLIYTNKQVPSSSHLIQ